jgi:hypothetical protein
LEARMPAKAQWGFATRFLAGRGRDFLLALAQRHGCFVRSIKMRVVSTKMHIYEVRSRSDKRGVNLISEALPFGRLWYGAPNTISNAIAYAKFTRHL